jgi:hypothetical protein
LKNGDAELKGRKPTRMRKVAADDQNPAGFVPSSAQLPAVAPLTAALESLVKEADPAVRPLIESLLAGQDPVAVWTELLKKALDEA